MNGGWLGFGLGVGNVTGPWARVEAGWHPLGPLSLYGYGQVSRSGWEAGGGLGYTF